ncbi:MAG: sulfur carrier protein ThiS adenylyltransferase ThiF [Candidatus Coatesbacteria bacterium]|nr:sulfur carrier protein ThiS adenylyltransferase ThiF [Candidatus Coatesbacteria bacterium]
MVYSKDFIEDCFAKNPPDSFKILSSSVIGIAGVGGLGSNVAVSLARAGIGKIILCDFDTVQASNLNRQQFRIDQIGKMKVDALKEYLLLISPIVDVVTITNKLNEDNIKLIFKDADIIIEAFDLATEKYMLIEEVIKNFPEKYIISASGLAGYGAFTDLGIRNFGKLYICGDEKREANEKNGLCAPRVAIVANMQANLAIEILLDVLNR